MAIPTPAEERAFRVGQEWLRYLAAPDGFRTLAPQTMGNQIRKLLSALSIRQASFGGLRQSWEVVRESVRLTLLHIATMKAIYDAGPRARLEPYPLTPAIVLLGTEDPRFTDIDVTQVDKATARMFGILASSLVDQGVIPERFASYAYPTFLGGGISARPRVTIEVPMGPIRTEIRRGIREEFARVRGAPAPTPAAPTIVSEAPPPPPPRAEEEAFMRPPPPAAPEEQEVRSGWREYARERGLSLFDRNAPLFLTDVVGHPTQLSRMRQWVRGPPENWPRCVLAFGPPGTGKSSAIEAMVRTYLVQLGRRDSYQYVTPQGRFLEGVSNVVLLRRGDFVPARFDQTFAHIKNFLKAAPTNNPRKKKFLVLDDSEPTEGQQKAIEGELNRPGLAVNNVFIMTTNFVDKVTPSLQSRCRDGRLAFGELGARDVEPALLRVAREEGWNFPDLPREVRAAATESGGDVRAAIGDLAGRWAEYQGGQP